MRNVFISDLASKVIEKEILSERAEKGKWLTVPYETGDYKGNMLAAHEMSFPAPVTLKTGVKGKFKVYLGLCGTNGTVSTGVSLGAEGTKDVIDFIPELGTPEPHWSPYDFLREYFYKAADLTENDEITFFKPGSSAPLSSIIAYIRLEEMTEEQFAEYNRPFKGHVNCHLDQDYLCDVQYSSPEEYTSRLKMLKGMGCGTLFHENFLDDCDAEYNKGETHYLASHAYIDDALINYRAKKSEIKQKLIDTAHGMGLKVMGAYRMEAGDFFYPFSMKSHNSGRQDKFPGCRIKTRDGREVKVASYAYPEVREEMVKAVVNACEGFDGAALILHRGVHVAFEQPVLDGVREKFGVDARTLPVTDPRLREVQCGFMTEYMRALRKALPPEKEITAIVFYDPEDCINYALDIETWAKEGLVTGVAQGIMRHFEDLEGCLDKEGLIDLDKYKELIKTRQPVKRDYYDGDFDRIEKGSREFLKICDKYGVKYYGTLGWEHMAPETAMELALRQKKAGVKELFSWDGNHKAKRPPILCAEKFISANYENLENCAMPAFNKFTRLLSVMGRDISAFNPNWKG